MRGHLVAGEIIIPDAIWSPFSGKGTTPVQPDILCVHTEVGTNEGSIAIGAQAGHSYAHNYLDCLGFTFQKRDLRYRAAANLDGNPYVISWETEDIDSRCFAAWGTSCGNVPAWTPAQVARLILDLYWCCVRFNIPPVLIPDTKVGRRGIGFHRQGVPNSPEWVPGSLRWSSSIGKCCPDWRRIAQLIGIIIPAVAARVAGIIPPPPSGANMDDYVLDSPGIAPYLISEATGATPLDANTIQRWCRDAQPSDRVPIRSTTNTALALDLIARADAPVASQALLMGIGMRVAFIQEHLEAQPVPIASLASADLTPSMVPRAIEAGDGVPTELLAEILALEAGSVEIGDD